MSGQGAPGADRPRGGTSIHDLRNRERVRERHMRDMIDAEAAFDLVMEGKPIQLPPALQPKVLLVSRSSHRTEDAVRIRQQEHLELVWRVVGREIGQFDHREVTNVYLNGKPAAEALPTLDAGSGANKVFVDQLLGIPPGTDVLLFIRSHTGLCTNMDAFRSFLGAWTPVPLRLSIYLWAMDPKPCAGAAAEAFASDMAPINFGVHGYGLWLDMDELLRPAVLSGPLHRLATLWGDMEGAMASRDPARSEPGRRNTLTIREHEDFLDKAIKYIGLG